MFEHKCTINHKLFAIAVSASSFETDADNEFDESFPKRRMLPKNKTLPRNVKNKQKLINAITVTKQEHTIYSRLERSVECGLTYGVFILSHMVM